MKYTEAENNMIADVIRQNFRSHIRGKYGKSPDHINTEELLPNKVKNFPERYPVAKQLERGVPNTYLKDADEYARLEKEKRDIQAQIDDLFEEG